MDTYRLASESDLNIAQDALRDAPLDGSLVMAIKPKGSKSDRQRRLQWMLYRAIAKSGMGHSDTPEEIDLDAKWLFRNIWLADDDFKLAIFQYVCSEYPERKKEWVKNELHTEQLNVSQMSEFLTSIYNYYGAHGIELPTPEEDLLERFETNT